MSKINSRTKGHAYELQIIKLFKDLGWTSCVSSRSESKRTDDQGIDLCYTDPWQIQAKAWESAPSYHAVLEKMPKKKGIFNVIFHKRNRKGSVVVMSEDDFLAILNMLLESGKVQPNAAN